MYTYPVITTKNQSYPAISPDGIFFGKKKRHGYRMGHVTMVMKGVERDLQQFD